MGFNYAISDAANLTLIDNKSKNIVLYTKYANQTNLEFTSDQIYAMAKGVRAVRFDHNKAATMNCEFEVFDLKWLSVLLGGSWKKATDLAVREEIVIAGVEDVPTLTDIKLSGEPVAGSLSIFKLLEDGVGHGDELPVKSTGEGAPLVYYEITDNKISITDDITTPTIAIGDKFVAYYIKELDSSTTAAEVIEIKTDEYPVAYTIIGDTMMKQKHSNVMEYIQFKCGNATPRGAVTLTMQAGGVTTLSAVFDLMGDADNNFVTITKL